MLCNVNTKINKITKNEKQSDYAVSFTHSVSLNYYYANKFNS